MDVNEKTVFIVFIHIKIKFMISKLTCFNFGQVLSGANSYYGIHLGCNSGWNNAG